MTPFVADNGAALPIPPPCDDTRARIRLPVCDCGAVSVAFSPFHDPKPRAWCAECWNAKFRNDR